MTNYFKSVTSNFILGIGTTSGEGNITEVEYNELATLFANKPSAPSGYIYKLTDNTHEWVLVEAGGGE